MSRGRKKRRQIKKLEEDDSFNLVSLFVIESRMVLHNNRDWMQRNIAVLLLSITNPYFVLVISEFLYLVLSRCNFMQKPGSLLVKLFTHFSKQNFSLNVISHFRDCSMVNHKQYTFPFRMLQFLFHSSTKATQRTKRI